MSSLGITKHSDQEPKQVRNNSRDTKRINLKLSDSRSLALVQEHNKDRLHFWQRGCNLGEIAMGIGSRNQTLMNTQYYSSLSQVKELESRLNSGSRWNGSDIRWDRKYHHKFV